jgi:hypothetical protein
MTTAFATITAGIVALLGAAPAVSPNIFRARDRQMAEEYATAINVQFDGGVPNPGAMKGAPVDWGSRFTVECYARTSTTSGDLAVDPLLEAVYEKIAADSTLGGLVMDIGSPLIEAEYGSEGQKTGWIRMTYPVLHRTANLTLD